MKACDILSLKKIEIKVNPINNYKRFYSSPTNCRLCYTGNPVSFSWAFGTKRKHANPVSVLS
jgi:hypothetical protein